MFQVVEYSKKNKKGGKILQSVLRSSINPEMNYEQFLSSRRPIKLVNEKYSVTKVKKNVLRYIPPLNTDIRISHVLPAASTEMKVRASQLPTSWDSRTKWNILPALNQGLCGSCWTMGSAAVVSDVFAVINGSSNPNLSPTYILSTFGQGQCAGGNPSEAIKNISENGISNTTCIDYTWCSGNDNCNGNSTAHFEADPNALNKLIPQPGASCNKSGPYSLYYVDNPVSLSATSPSEVPNIINRAKEHIITYGSIIGTYHVLANFISGDYSSTNNIYIESNSYGVTDPTAHLGDHCIRIIGYGQDTVSGEGVVPYWLCYNSWGDSWGVGGTFKIACYPINKISQMEFASQTSDGDTLGGMVLVRPGKIVTQNLGQITNPPPSTSMSFSLSKTTGMSIFYIFLIIVILTVFYFTVKRLINRNRR